MYPKKACAEGNDDNGNLERKQICKKYTNVPNQYD